jgi:hypothetical protein
LGPFSDRLCGSRRADALAPQDGDRFNLINTTARRERASRHRRRDRGPPGSFEAAASAVVQALRLRDSTVAEIVCLGLAIAGDDNLLQKIRNQVKLAP